MLRFRQSYEELNPYRINLLFALRGDVAKKRSGRPISRSTIEDSMSASLRLKWWNRLNDAVQLSISLYGDTYRTLVWKKHEHIGRRMNK